MILDLTLPAYHDIVCRVAKDETNDCAVLALHWAAGISYEQSHAIYESLGRKRGEGVPVSVTLEAVELAGWRPKTYKTRSTVADWLRYGVGKGRVLVVIPNHIFAVVDGVPLDSIPLDTRAPVLGVIRLCRRASASTAPA